MPERIDKSKEAVWQIVAAIPKGKVATYGQVAELAGMPNQSRLVGKILSRLPAGSRLPWHRVVASGGRIASPSAPRQLELLEKEGIVLMNGRVRMKDYQWQP